MKRTLTTLFAIAALTLALAVSGAGANGSPYSPGLAYGWAGVGASNGVHYVTLGPSKWTVVSAIRAHDGHVVRTRTLRGFYGIPLVSYDGTTGGLSGDGRSLVMASYGPLPGEAGTTRFVALRTKTLEPYRLVKLGGSWSYDAISPDGRALYLVEHLSAGPDARYRVRVFDLLRGRLLPGAIVDRLEKASVMGGQPATRVSSPDGRWAYTLYARAAGEPFVHALDTVNREAFCIDLPLHLGEPMQMGLRLALERGELLVRNGRATVAVVNTRTWAVSRS
jgi:hypothetical protein